MKFHVIAWLAGLAMASAADMTCSGKIVSDVIDFETMKKDTHLPSGFVPYELTNAVKVLCHRAEKSKHPAAENDCVIFDTSRPKQEKNLASETEGNVLIINRDLTQDKLRSNP